MLAEGGIRIHTVLIPVVIAAAVLLLVFWLGQRRLMYFPGGHVISPADAGVPNAEPVTFTTLDGVVLAGWFLRADAPRATVIVFNGNAGNRSHRAGLGAALSAHGFSVLLFDYRGYGGNEGAPTEQGLAEDARAARRYLASRPDVEADRIVYFGESLGAAVAIALAVEHPPAAMVLRSPFTSAVDVARHHYRWLPVGWLLSDRYPSIERIPGVAVPALFIAGDRDSVVPAAQTEALYEAAPEPKSLFVMAGADHNDAALAQGPDVIARVAAFLTEHLGNRTPDGAA